VSTRRACTRARPSADSLPEPGRVDVGGDDQPVRAHPPGEPLGDTATTGPDLPAPPPGRDAEVGEVAERRRVEDLGQRAEPGPGLDLLIVEQIALVGLHVRRFSG
jgi:hypothetical protein